VFKEKWKNTFHWNFNVDIFNFFLFLHFKNEQYFLKIKENEYFLKVRKIFFAIFF